MITQTPRDALTTALARAVIGGEAPEPESPPPSRNWFRPGLGLDDPPEPPPLPDFATCLALITARRGDLAGQLADALSRGRRGRQPQ
jgi:hypothetical protein